MLTFLWCQPPNIIFYYGSSSRFAWAERLKNSLNNSLRWPRKISLSTLPSCWKGFFGEGSKASLTWWPLPSGPIIFSSQGLEVETGWQGQLQWLRHCGTDFSLLCSKHTSNPTFYLCIPLVGITGLQNPYDNKPFSISMQKSFFSLIILLVIIPNFSSNSLGIRVFSFSFFFVTIFIWETISGG